MHPTPYLFFQGDCFEAMTLYADGLGGKVVAVMRNSDAPPEDQMPGGDEMIMHMAVQTDGGMIYASDNPAEYYERPQGMRLHIEVTSLAEFDRLHDLLAKDARDIAMAPSETMWSERFAMFTDRFGTPWMLDLTGAKAV
ncbi:MAG: PhnB protein [Roseibaca calidilacus]|uniref:PhnB protein n=1 Tax=Roseibaca calidilacus TaxID=1666912 RepID=A0A0P7WHT9_9RHOB|nr:VOC family protein [Roseibaca calidilacus]KPP93567.1 MAG: PhnB protein [Roseibaca calidilacus]CUX80434.1 PhnB protein [Roseibaca calidilacus]